MFSFCVLYLRNCVSLFSGRSRSWRVDVVITFSDPRRYVSVKEEPSETLYRKYFYFKLLVSVLNSLLHPRTQLCYLCKTKNWKLFPSLFFLEPNGVEQSNESSRKYNFATPSSYFKLPILFCFVFYQIVGNNSVKLSLLSLKETQTAVGKKLFAAYFQQVNQLLLKFISIITYIQFFSFHAFPAFSDLRQSIRFNCLLALK